MTWAKIDTALHRNPKVRMAGRNARDVYLFVVLANADAGADGEMNSMILNPEYLADQLQCSVEDAIDGVKRCETFHLLHVTGSIVAICGWDEEWKVKTSTDRVRKYRAQKKQEVGPDETLRNVSSVSCNGETHREIDREIEKTERVPRKRAHALPSDWLPTEAHVALAASERVNINTEADQFRDHALATGRLMKDWDAAFRTWLRKASKFSGSKPENRRAPERILL